MTQWNRAKLTGHPFGDYPSSERNAETRGIAVEWLGSSRQLRTVVPKSLVKRPQAKYLLQVQPVANSWQLPIR